MLLRTPRAARVRVVLAVAAATISFPGVCLANVIDGGFGSRAFANPGMYDFGTPGYIVQPVGETTLQKNVLSSTHSSTLSNTPSRIDSFDLGFNYDTGQEVIANIPWSASMSASASVTAAPGVLHLFASARATLQPASVPLVDASNTPVLAASPLRPWSSSEVSGEVQDTITITSPTLNQNAPVDIRANLAVHLAHSADPTGGYDVTVYLIVGHKNVGPMDNPDPNAPNPSAFSFMQYILNLDGTESAVEYPTAVIHTFVGDQLTFSLNALVRTNAGLNNSVTPSNPDVSVTADLANTILLNLDPITAGTSFTSATGTSYFTAVPEPVSAAVLAAAVPLLGLKRREVVRRG